MIILLLLGVSVSLKGFKDEYLSLVSMTLIGDAEFGVSNLFTQFFFLSRCWSRYDCTSELLRAKGRHGYFPNFHRYLLDFISKSVISSSPGIASGKNTDTMWCAEFFFRFFHSWRVYSFFSNFSYSTRLKVTSFLGFPQSTGKEVTRFCNFLKNLLGQITRFLEKSTRLGYSFFLTSNWKNE